MGHESDTMYCYVIKAGELVALNYLPRNHPRPRLAEWINRGTDQKLRRTTIDLLLRTLFQEPVSPSIAQLRETTGLRLVFKSEKERGLFAAAFAVASQREAQRERTLAIAVFNNRAAGEQAVNTLTGSGIPASAVSLLWRAGQLMTMDRPWPEGHSKMDVARAIAGGGIASALLGAGLLAIPGLGTLAAVGAVAAASGSIGATGAAIAKMLSDYDVDDIIARYFEREVRSGKVFVTVDLRNAADRTDAVRDILRRAGGQVVERLGSAVRQPADRAA